ncbi:MAG: beta-propeller domain-containing protein [Thiothrix sp.]|nr:beta-propeller domain-containing protein [Thiothrix sp.]
MGKPGEPVYATRFAGDRGYLVTFRQTDPLCVLDLSSPTAPVLTGELTLPGYSDYLHRACCWVSARMLWQTTVISRGHQRVNAVLGTRV